jgi:hypothetical protein
MRKQSRRGRRAAPDSRIWDDAVVDGLVRIDRRSGDGAIVVLTALGQRALAAGAG